jgi:hypothetical protein
MSNPRQVYGKRGAPAACSDDRNPMNDVPPACRCHCPDAGGFLNAPQPDAPLGARAQSHEVVAVAVHDERRG